MKRRGFEPWFRTHIEKELWRKLYVGLASRFSEALPHQGESLSVRERHVVAAARRLQAEASTLAPTSVDLTVLIDEAVRDVEVELEAQRLKRMAAQSDVLQ